MVNGCISGGVCAGIPPLCFVGSCIAGFVGSIAEQLCMSGTALNDTCGWATAISSGAIGCLGGYASEVSAKEKLILFLTGLDISSITALCGSIDGL